MATRRRFLQASLSALLAPRLTRAAEGVLVCRPYVQNVRKTRAVVRWITLNPGEASVGFVSPNGEERLVKAVTAVMPPSQTGLAMRFRHEATLTGLEPGTDYGYRILLDGRSLGSEGFAFRTAGAQGARFLVVGDTGSGTPEQRLLATQMVKEDPRFVIHTGDLAYPSGTYELYEQHYFDYYHALMGRAPFYPTPGNHDYYEAGGAPYFTLHDLPGETVAAAEHGRYYTFEWADAQFFSLDSNDTLEAAVKGNSDMLRWLARELEASRKFWRVVFFHHPPFASGAHDADPLCELARRHVTPILERFAVPLVFNGHEHSYQRSHPVGGVTYITTGGGGAVLHEARPSPVTAVGVSAYHYVRAEVNGPRMDLRAIGLDGAAIDSLTLRPAPRLAPAGVVNAASFTASIGRGGLISLFGWHFSVETRDNAGRPIGDPAPGVEVSISGQPLPLLMVSPTQINAVLPAGLVGLAQVEVATAGGAARADIEILPVAPALFADTFVADSPIRAGVAVQVFATGCSAYQGVVTVHAGGLTTSGQVAAGELEGLSVVSFVVPELRRGAWPVSIEVAGMKSNAVPLTVG